MSLSLKNNYNSKVSDALFNDSPISIFILNNEGAVKSANNSAVKLLKSTIIDIQSKTIFELFPEINLIFPKRGGKNYIIQTIKNYQLKL